NTGTTSSGCGAGSSSSPRRPGAVPPVHVAPAVAADRAWNGERRQAQVRPRRFDPAHFDRLHERVVAAGNDGIYVGVTLLEGWGLHLSPAPDDVEGHPFHAANNVNRVGIDFDRRLST